MRQGNKQFISQYLMFAFKLICGIAILATGIWMLQLWRWEAMVFIKGFMVVLVILIGVIALAIAKD